MPDLCSPRAIVLICGARAAYVGPSLRLTAHRNAVAVVAVGLDAPFALTDEHGAERTDVALIAPGRKTRLEGEGRLVFLYLDAFSSDHQALRRGLPADLRTRFEARPEVLDSGDAAELFGLAGLPLRGARDHRITAAVRRLDAELSLSTASAARLTGLSPSRFQVVFRREAGAPYRRYRTWRRMAAALSAAVAGRSLTEAAHAAHFASSAHFSAAFRGMFCLSPSHLLASLER